MKIIVAAASGFLGSHVVDRLMMDGHNVVATTRRGKYPVNELVPLIRVDLDRIDEVSALVNKYRPDVIVSCAGLASTPESLNNPLACVRDNFLTTANILEVARVNRLSRVVLASSNVVYGAESPYKAAKIAGELLASSYTASYGLSVVSLRFANLYSERQRSFNTNSNFIAACISAKERGDKVTLFGDGSAKRDWLHVEDAARAASLAVTSSYSGVLDICSGAEMSVREIVDTLGVQVGYRLATRPGDVPSLPQSSALQLSELGFRPEINLKEWLCRR